MQFIENQPSLPLRAVYKASYRARQSANYNLRSLFTSLADYSIPREECKYFSIAVPVRIITLLNLPSICYYG